MNDKKLLAEYKAALKKHGTQRKACIAIGVPRSTMQGILARAEQGTTSKAPSPTFRVSAPHRPKSIITKDGEVCRFILSAAQDDSAVHHRFLDNLETYASYLGAEIMIAGFTYNKALFEDHSTRAGWFHPRVQKYLVQTSIIINDSLVFCGEMNTLPTAVNPLSGFEVYTRHRSGIFPHAKVQLQSIPTMRGDYAKMNMTTGAVTMPNYVQKRAGILAQFHHVIGAVLVEVDGEGDWFARHLIADSFGDFCDLDVSVHDGSITLGLPVEAINWGDIHFPQVDAEVRDEGWIGKDSMLDVLKPAHQFIHDVSDFNARNHHNIKDPHHRYRVWWNGTDDIRETFSQLAGFLGEFRRPWSDVVVVESNHDLAFERWLREADWKTDPVNAELYLEANLRLLQSLQMGEADFSILKWAIDQHDHQIDDITFLKEDQSYRICVREDDTGIECGMHGHLGANGAKGTPRQYTRMGPKANTGHTHSASIMDGIYTAGTSSLLDLGYNKGLSSWSHSHIVTYQNGKRAIITMKEGKWRAE